MGRRTRQLIRQVTPLAAQALGLREADPPLVIDAPRFPGPDEWAALPYAVAWLGQATTLLRLAGRTILTDPHFREHAGPVVAGRPTGRRRSVALPVDPAALPRPDVILLSHAHLDHWDIHSLRPLAHPETAVVIPKRTRPLLPPGFGDVIELHWDRDARLPAPSARANAPEPPALTVRAIKPAHWGARYLLDAHRGYNAYLLETPDDTPVLFAGDTGHTHAFDHLGRSGPGVGDAILGIGNSYEPWRRHHASPEQAADMARRMNASRIVPIHHSTFRDPSEPIDEPLERLRRVWAPRPIACPRVGDLTSEKP